MAVNIYFPLLSEREVLNGQLVVGVRKNFNKNTAAYHNIAFSFKSTVSKWLR